MNRAKKLDFLLNNYMSGADVIRAFGFKTASMITNMRNGHSNIANIHIEALERHFNIPTTIFDDSIVGTDEIVRLIEKFQDNERKKEKQETLKNKILKKLEEQELVPRDIFNKSFQEKGELDRFIKEHKVNCLEKSISINKTNNFSNQVFPNNERLFKKLKGVWYGYIYPSNPLSAEHGIWEVKTIIGDDYSVVDEPWGNAGYLKIGKNESLIIKESYDHDDLTVIRFSNRQVPSGHFRFVIVSNQNHTLHEMVNFGFFSRKQYDLEEAKKILGNVESKQLKLDIGFNERLIERAIVPQ